MDNKRINQLALWGRILLSAIFVISGIGKIFSWNENVNYMISSGVPFAGFLLFCAIVFEVVAGVSLLIGFQSRWAASALFLYLIPVTLVFHHFWTLEGMPAMVQRINFMKNLAIMGGLLEVVAFGSGAISVDRRYDIDELDENVISLQKTKRAV